MNWFKRLFRRRAKRGSVQGAVYGFIVGVQSQMDSSVGDLWPGLNKKDIYEAFSEYRKTSIVSAISAMIAQGKIERLEDGRLRKV